MCRVVKGILDLCQVNVELAQHTFLKDSDTSAVLQISFNVLRDVA